MALSEPLAFERIIAPRNPVSTNARRGQRMIRLLDEAYPGQLHELETHRDRQTTIERIASDLREGDVVVPIGGDSTVTQAATAITLRSDLGKVPIAPLPLGHANQMALMLNSSLSYKRPLRIFQRGKTIPIFPFLYQAETWTSEQALLALFAIGIGFTGATAARLESAEFRGDPLRRLPVLKKIPEARAVWHGLMKTRPLRKDGQERIEVLFVNGRRVAKHGRFDVELPERALALLELPDKRLVHLVPTFARFFMQLTQPSRRITEQSVEFLIEAVDGAPIMGQHDGQPFPVEPGRITIRRAEHPIYGVTTRRSLYEAASEG